MRIAFGILLACLWIGSAAAQESVTVNEHPDHKAMALKIAEEFVTPRYEALLARAQAQSEAWNAFCAAPSDEGFEQIKAQFVDTVDAWANVEPIRYGPVSENFRYERLAYWPERKNDVARGLTRMLSETDELTPEAMAGKSVAVQGLSALERLVYEDGARDALFAGDAGANRRCAAGRAISGNVERIAGEIVEAWKPLAEQFRTSDVSVAREAVTRFATDLLTIYQIVGDQKLDVPMGKSVEEAKPKSAQWWRSGLSNRTIARNMQAAADLSWILLGQTNAGRNVVGTIETAQSLAESLPGPLPDLVADPAKRVRLVLLRNAVRGARDLSAIYVPPSLGITVGFNSLDGD